MHSSRLTCALVSHSWQTGALSSIYCCSLCPSACPCSKTFSPKLTQFSITNWLFSYVHWLYLSICGISDWLRPEDSLSLRESQASPGQGHGRADLCCGQEVWGAGLAYTSPLTTSLALRQLFGQLAPKHSLLSCVPENVRSAFCRLGRGYFRNRAPLQRWQVSWCRLASNRSWQQRKFYSFCPQRKQQQRQVCWLSHTPGIHPILYLL